MNTATVIGPFSRISVTSSWRSTLAIFSHRSRGPGLRIATATLAVALAKAATPTRSRAATSRLARAAGAHLFSALAGPHPHSLSRGDFAPRSGRRRSSFFSARGAPPPLALARRLRASLGPQALIRHPPSLIRHRSVHEKGRDENAAPFDPRTSISVLENRLFLRHRNEDVLFVAPHEQ